MKVTALGFALSLVSLAVFVGIAAHNVESSPLDRARELQGHERAALDLGDKITRGIIQSTETIERVRRNHEKDLHKREEPG